MLKVAFLAAALAVATTAQAVNVDSTPGMTPVEAPACHPAQAQDLDCVVRALDADAAPTTTDPSGLDFKDASAESISMLAAIPDAGRRHGLLPALFALGALVVLLRQRPV